VYLAAVSRSLRPPRPWLLALIALPLLGVAYLQTSGVEREPGFVNVACYILVGLSALLALLWFVVASGLTRRSRLGSVAVLAAGALAGAGLVELEGWTGNMVPIFRPRFRASKDLALESTGRAVDLSVVAATDSPGFLGPRRDGSVDLTLDHDWGARPPQELWRTDVGEGWSGFALVGQVALTQEQRGDQQAVTAYDLGTGELLWIHSWPGQFDQILGGPGPRSTPTVAEGRVVALGPRARLVCLDGATGAPLWSHDLRAAYGMTDALEEKLIAFGRANSPLVHAGRVIVPAGGDPDGRQAGLVAFDLASGELLWEGPPRQVSFASPVLATLCGREQVLIVNEDSASGHDPADGTLLWEHPWPGSTSGSASCSNARPLSGDRVLLSKGYGIGSALLKLRLEDEGITPTVVWRVPRALRTKFTNVVVFDDLGVALSDGILMAADLADGRRVWKDGRYGHGQVLRIGPDLLVLSEEGELLLVDPSREGGGAVRARHQVLRDKTWNQPALAGDVLVVRNGQEAVALRLPTRER